MSRCARRVPDTPPVRTTTTSVRFGALDEAGAAVGRVGDVRGSLGRRRDAPACRVLRRDARGVPGEGVGGWVVRVSVSAGDRVFSHDRYEGAAAGVLAVFRDQRAGASHAEPVPVRAGVPADAVLSGGVRHPLAVRPFAQAVGGEQWAVAVRGVGDGAVDAGGGAGRVALHLSARGAARRAHRGAHRIDRRGVGHADRLVRGHAAALSARARLLLRRGARRVLGSHARRSVVAAHGDPRRRRRRGDDDARAGGAVAALCPASRRCGTSSSGRTAVAGSSAASCSRSRRWSRSRRR